MPKIDEAKILIIATHGFEQSELEVPRDRLREKGATVHVARWTANPPGAGTATTGAARRPRT